MKPSNSLLALSVLALTTALSTACVAPETASEPNVAETAQAAQALSGETRACGEGAEFSFTPRDDGSFHFHSAGYVCKSSGAVWAKVRNFNNVIPVFLPGIATHFQWVEGGNPGQVPSRYELVVNGNTLLEEIDLRSEPEQLIGYHLVQPMLGIEQYAATIDVNTSRPGEAYVVFDRDMRFVDPALAPGFAALFEVEMGNLKSYFASEP